MDDPLSGQNLAFVESLYADFLEDPSSVPDDWRAYFRGLGTNGNRAADLRGPSFSATSIFGARGGNGRASLDVAALQDRLDQLVRAYRVRGHMIADLDPLGLHRDPHPELALAHYGFSEADLGLTFSARTLSGPAVLTLGEIIERLRTTYCSAIGVQFMHIDDLEVKSWLQTRMEQTQNRLELSREQQIRVLTKLTDAEIFEQFLHRKFLGAKRFSLEGGESLIPLLDQALEEVAAHGAEEVVIAMAHRGRLNVLANFMGKDPTDIFREFADLDPDLYFGGGDVKYHMGYSSDHTTQAGGHLHLSLCFNPSHLEFVNPVLLGRCRAKQDRRGDTAREKVVPILVHGDAAFAGQGIVQETLNLSGLAGYSVGGTLHIILNNQIGFTTPPESSRSTYYATDVARMLEIPVFHVNGEHPEAVAQAVKLAMDFRHTFQRDAVIDMWCYRRYGHNEGDDPTFTNPTLYQTVHKQKSVRDGYLDNVIALGAGITREDADAIAVKRRARLDSALDASRDRDYAYKRDFGRGLWQGYLGGDDAAVPDADTRVPRETLVALADALADLPDDFTAHPKIGRLLDTRKTMARGEKALDWGCAETLGFASLISEGVRIRLSGQDAGRGTFSHRHCVLHDHVSGARHIPLDELGDSAGPFEPLDSPLSEAGVLGFDFGYSLDMPDALVIWEAQFGDFANGAQVIIDQFISTCEDKWHRLSGLVMFLPHAFEGQGPEHSSARLERWLGLSAEDNMTVCYLTTPAQIFHALRRHMLRPIRKPMVVLTPKSLLRHPEATSDISELTDGAFQRVIPDREITDPKGVRRVILCTGKVYYDLLATRRAIEADDVAIHRLEQLYPLRPGEIAGLFEGYAEDVPVVWVQEEPENMGAWPYMRLRFGENIHGHRLRCVTRPESASPATGSKASHTMEQDLLMEQAFELS